MKKSTYRKKVDAAIKEYYDRFDSIFGRGFTKSPSGRRLTTQIIGPLEKGQVVAIVKSEPAWATVYANGTPVAEMFVPKGTAPTTPAAPEAG